MTLFQLILLLIAVAIAVIFFKQLFSGNYPKRGIDYEAKTPKESIGGISTPSKMLKGSSKIETDENLDRVSQLINMADEALQKKDNIEAKKALQSALHHDPNNPEVLRRLGVVYMNMYDYTDAKDTLLHLLQINPNDDLAHSLLANALHKLGEDDEALLEHQKAISLDSKYAPHYYNYANTLFDLGRIDEARENYKKALELDPNLQEAKDALKEIDR